MYCFYSYNFPIQNPESPRIVPFSFGPGEEALNAGTHATLQCSVDQGDMPLSLQWIFHGKELSSQMGIETAKFGKRTNMLTIESLAPFHAGNYTVWVLHKD